MDNVGIVCGFGRIGVPMNATDPLAQHFRLDAPHRTALKRLNIYTVQDLLLHLPARYEDVANVEAVASLAPGDTAVVYGRLSGLASRKAWKSKRPIAEGKIEDSSGAIKVMWFNQPYIAKMYEDGVYIKATGKVAGGTAKPYLSNPELERLDHLPIDQHDSLFGGETTEGTLYPVYRETKGITSRWIYHAVLKCFASGVLENLVDPLPTHIRTRYTLPDLATALLWIHTPRKAHHAESARKRFAFFEVFAIQIAHAKERAAADAAHTYQVKPDVGTLQEFLDSFDFPLTHAQTRAVETIMADLQGQRAMSRLLEGDVGSGKTAVAAATAYAVAASRPPEGTRVQERGSAVAFGNLQVAYMAPTEILAKQHFESFCTFFRGYPMQIGLITGATCYKFPSKANPKEATRISRAQLLRFIASGEVSIVIGTHALIYQQVRFRHLAYVIIDEQHRFGTAQRRQLTHKDARIPHLLSMTATPIPRTLALTLYGDLDITLLDELPPGRKAPITQIIGPGESDRMYEHVKDELAAGRQVYVICPRIDEPDENASALAQQKSVTAEAARLQRDVFPNYRIQTLHGRMTPREKDAVMRDFLAHRFDILVATSVVEVGVSVANATNIIIEGAERFGLAQLHQLRGRVMRSHHQPYCFAVTESKSEKTRERLHALAEAANGFELAEHDLKHRGAGELYGGKQSGLSDLGMTALTNLKLVEAAREEARTLVDNDPELATYHALATYVATLSERLHLE